MAITLYSTVKLASVPCTAGAFRFAPTDFRHRTVSKLQKVYCILVGMLLCFLWTFDIITKVCDSQVTFISGMFMVADMAAAATTTYYRVKFIAASSVTANNLGNLDYADKCLSSLGMTVPYKRHHYTWTTYTITLIGHNSVYAYVLVRSMTSPKREQYDISLELITFLYLVSKMTLFFSGPVSYTHLDVYKRQS